MIPPIGQGGRTVKWFTEDDAILGLHAAAILGQRCGAGAGQDHHGP
jgi:hypothetical protein